MANDSTQIVQKLWNSACLTPFGADKYCNVLRDDGMSYGDYVEAALFHPWNRGIRTSLFSTVGLFGFLKMADEPACTCRRAGKPGAGD
jgi:hypothetical protein